MSSELREYGLSHPTMVLDLDAMDRNIAQVVSGVEERKFRIVAKSLPSEPLLSYVMERSESRRLMVFHGPFAESIARAHPRADLVFGKPMPVAAADSFYRRNRFGTFDPASQMQWLIDSPERFRQYHELARSHGITLRLNFEIDVGLHRGGLSAPAELAAMVEEVRRSQNLTFGGLMGYDPHVAKLPKTLGMRDREFARVREGYQAFRDVVRSANGLADQDLIFNAAGSPTYRMWRSVDGIANDLSVGSGLVKPMDFDIDTLREHEPALFIATPVLKASNGLRLPGLDGVGSLHGLWDRNRARTFFIYGGYWKARPVSPHGLETNPVFGRSTNQEMLNGSASVDLDVDDYVFLRPTQSEFVMLQFGDIAVVRGGRIIDFWAPLSSAA